MGNFVYLIGNIVKRLVTGNARSWWSLLVTLDHQIKTEMAQINKTMCKTEQNEKGQDKPDHHDHV